MVKCNYCHKAIDEDEPGYMFEEHESRRVYYHSECFEYESNVAIA